MELFYSSTRDKAEKVTASQAILQGLAQMEVYMFLLISRRFRWIWMF